MEYSEFLERKKGKHKKILVCGLGTSLELFDQSDKVCTIGVNDIERIFTPEYLLLANTKVDFSPERIPYIENSRAKYILINHGNYPLTHTFKFTNTLSHVVRYGLGLHHGYDIEKEYSLDYSNLSTYIATIVAYQLGAKIIGTIGVDMTFDHIFGKTGQHNQSGEFKNIDLDYTNLAKALKNKGVWFYNLSPYSRLTNIPKISVKKFMDL